MPVFPVLDVGERHDGITSTASLLSRIAFGRQVLVEADVDAGVGAFGEFGQGFDFAQAQQGRIDVKDERSDEQPLSHSRKTGGNDT